MRCLFPATFFLIAASPQIPSEPPPAVLASYIQSGTFQPKDYRWLRGQFDGASEADKADYTEIVGWRKRCRTNDLARTRADLASMGIVAEASLRSIPYRTLICSQIASLPASLNLHDWDGFTRDVATVQPIAQGFFAAVMLAEKAAEPESSDLRDKLNARSTGEQVLRRGLDWAQGNSADAPALSLTAQQRGILISEIAMAMKARDHANTQWLKDVVASQGWPKRTTVGDSASGIAWLLVQHADADPAFQARALRLMEPLVAAGEVNPKNYAYLYDRVMLKLVGKQRYASQLTCRAGRYVPQPLEDEGKVDSWRRQVGLIPLLEHQQTIAKEMGACSEAPLRS